MVFLLKNLLSRSTLKLLKKNNRLGLFKDKYFPTKLPHMNIIISC